MKPQRSSYRARAERAIGRPLTPQEHVHHHSDTQLVICSQAYHAWLHSEMRRLNIQTKKPVTYIIRKMDEDVWYQVKVKATHENRTVKAVIESLIAAWLKETP